MSYPLQAVLEGTPECSIYSVRSEVDETKWYLVCLVHEPAFGLDTCTCPHFINRHVMCKHIRIARAESGNSLLTPPTEDTSETFDLVLALSEAFLSGLELGRKVGRAEA